MNFSLEAFNYLTPEEQRELDSLLSDFELFGLIYKDDPAACIKHILDWDRLQNSLAFYQADALTTLADDRRLAIRSSRGAGKTFIDAAAAIWFALTREALGLDWAVAIVAPSWRQVQYEFREIHKLARAVLWDKVGCAPWSKSDELLKTQIQLDIGYTLGMASNDPTLLEGMHATGGILVIFAEAHAIPPEFWDAMEGVLTSQEAYALATSTPRLPVGRYYDIFSRKRGLEIWSLLTIKPDEAVEAGILSGEWVERVRKIWGAESSIFKNYVLGLFASDPGDALIQLAWLEDATTLGEIVRDQRPEVFNQIPDVTGIDVTGGGSSKSVLAPIWNNIEIELDGVSITVTVVGDLIKLNSDNPLDASRKAMELVGGRKTIPIVVDVIGAGLGTYKHLQDNGFNAIAFNANAGTTKTDRSNIIGFKNIRALAFYQVSERLNPQYEDRLALPSDDELIGELLAVRREYSGDKLKIPSKDELIKIIGHSPDSSDAVMYGLSDLAIHEHLEVRGGVKHDEFST